MVRELILPEESEILKGTEFFFNKKDLFNYYIQDIDMKMIKHECEATEFLIHSPDKDKDQDENPPSKILKRVFLMPLQVEIFDLDRHNHNKRRLCSDNPMVVAQQTDLFMPVKFKEQHQHTADMKISWIENHAKFIKGDLVILKCNTENDNPHLWAVYRLKDASRICVVDLRMCEFLIEAGTNTVTSILTKGSD